MRLRKFGIFCGYIRIKEGKNVLFLRDVIL